MSDPVLSVRNLTKRFGGLTAVNDVSWEIGPGEVAALLGDNGAGKSTLIKCISGVHAPDEGEIWFEGQKRSFSRPLDARGAGIETIYQDLALAQNLDVPANIFLGRELKHRYLGGLIKTMDDRSMLREASEGLKALDIVFPLLNQPIESLSGGQRQAVAIARAVYWKAKLMIMDEPTNNLGVPEQQKVLELIRKLRDQGTPLAYHYHMGTVVETPEEIDRFAEVTGDSVGILLDTGHLTFAGGNPLDVIAKWGHRINHVHCKDVRADVLKRAKATDSSFLNAVIDGVFTVPGDGCVDFPAVLKALKDANYRGQWLVIEAEQDPAKAHPLTYVTKGRQHLSALVAEYGL